MVAFFAVVGVLALAVKAMPNGPSVPYTQNVVRADNGTANGTACATGVHIIVARASTEKPGQGIIGAVASQVTSAVPGSDSEAVDYPATLTDYLNSEKAGVAGMQTLITNYVARCPSSKIALMGYSQGAQVAGDVMCGTSEANFSPTPPLSPELSKNVVAVLQMGDPAHTLGQTQNVGNATTNGIFPRLNVAACGNMAAITQSYCDNDDRFCANGTSIQVHIGYVQNYATQAAQFVIAKVNGNAGNGTKI